MCTCLYVCMCSCFMTSWVFVDKCTHQYTCLCMCECTCACPDLMVCTWVRNHMFLQVRSQLTGLYMCIYVCSYLCLHLYMHVYMSVCLHLCVHLCVFSCFLASEVSICYWLSEVCMGKSFCMGKSLCIGKSLAREVSIGKSLMRANSLSEVSMGKSLSSDAHMLILYWQVRITICVSELSNLFIYIFPRKRAI